MGGSGLICGIFHAEQRNQVPGYRKTEIRDGRGSPHDGCASGAIGERPEELARVLLFMVFRMASDEKRGKGGEARPFA